MGSISPHSCAITANWVRSAAPKLVVGVHHVGLHRFHRDAEAAADALVGEATGDTGVAMHSSRTTCVAHSGET